MSETVLFERESATAPASFPDHRGERDVAVSFRSRFVSPIGGREKQIIDRELNRRIARIGGRDIHGRPIWRLTFGYNEVLRDGMALRFPHVASEYLLLRLMPAWTWGTPLGWYAPRIDEGEWVPSFADTFREEYPALGAYEIDYAFPLGVRPVMPFIEDRIHKFNDRPKLPSVSQRRREDMAAFEAQELETWKRDYEACQEANRAFYGEPMRGYGAKSAAPRSNVEQMTPGMYRKVRAQIRARMERPRRRIGVN